MVAGKIVLVLAVVFAALYNEVEAACTEENFECVIKTTSPCRCGDGKTCIGFRDESPACVACQIEKLRASQDPFIQEKLAETELDKDDGKCKAFSNAIQTACKDKMSHVLEYMKC